MSASALGKKSPEKLRRKTEFASPFRAFGCFKCRREKYSASVFQKCMIVCGRPGPRRGTYASSRTLGAGCDGRFGRVRRTQPGRTAKSCGPDSPTLESSSAMHSQDDGG